MKPNPAPAASRARALKRARQLLRERRDYASDAALARAYQAADFFVSPSTNETGPMMAGEAMACGRPLIAYPIGIAPDLIEQGRNGTLVEPVGDVAALAAALREYAEMPSAELAARQQAAADSAGRIFSARYFSEQVQAVLRR